MRRRPRLAPVYTSRPSPAAREIRAVCSILVFATLFACTNASDSGDRAVFLIVVDTLRADRLSSYGYTGHATPGIDSLAARGLRFENAHSTASWTIPSMAAVMSAVYPSELGLVEIDAQPGVRIETRERRQQRRFTPPQDVDMLAERLGRAGYRSAAFVNQPGLNTLDGFLQGFDEWYYPVGRNRVVSHDPASSLPEQDWSRSLADAHHADQALVDQFEDWLADHGNERVFAWIHLLTPHWPHTGRPASAMGTRRPKTPSGLYDEEVQLVDAMVGRIVAAIERDAGFERSSVVFLSDHGEEFGEHGSKEHGHSLHREVTRVPLLVVAPAIAPGQTSTDHVSLLDVTPTLLALAGVQPNPQDAMRGASLVGAPTPGEEHRPIYLEGMLYGSSERSLIVDGWKLMTDEQADADLLYHLDSNPREKSNLARAKQKRARAMRLRLEAFRSKLDPMESGTAGDAADKASAEEYEAVAPALRALGYVE